MTVGERIKLKRTEKKMTLEDLGKLINVSRQTIFRYEDSTITNIPSDKIEMIAKVLNVSPAYLMGWEDEPQDYTPPKTIAAHATEDLTEEEQEKVREYIQFLKSKRELNQPRHKQT